MLPAGLPLVVAAFLLSSHGYPSQRRLKFWLEGLKDTQKELRGQVGATAGRSALAGPRGSPHWHHRGDPGNGSRASRPQEGLLCCALVMVIWSTWQLPESPGKAVFLRITDSCIFWSVTGPGASDSPGRLY